ncbi:MAG: hypothetical protein AAGA83_23875 [Cyanobacteria bacterium P01_F01_bin.116]
MPKVLDPQASYSFHSYFEMRYNVADILADLGFGYDRRYLNLPQSERFLDSTRIEETIQRNLRYAEPSSEAARREMLIAPVLVELCELLDARLDIEYPIKVSNWLKGSIDYRVVTTNTITVVEAKQADLTHGFVQLAAELIALDQWIEGDVPVLHGAVTTGEDWRFGILNRNAKQVTQDIALYRVPENVADLLRVLMAVA